MHFKPEVFGEGFHRFVQLETDIFGPVLNIIFHISTLVILFLVFRFGNRFRKLFVIYFACNWLFLFGYWGVYAIIYWAKAGLPYLAVYIITPVLLGLIVFQWIKEIIHPRIDLDFKDVHRFRYIVLLIMIWGFWYPTYIYGQEFIFSLKDTLVSSYGLMPCPTTMVVLSLMTLNYPKGNQTLYNLLTAYAIFIGTATVMTGWYPDIPFVFLGFYSLFLMWRNRIKLLLNH